MWFCLKNMQNGNLLAILFFLILAISNLGCAQSEKRNQKQPMDNSKTKNLADKNLETITLGAGCFWCVETIFQNLKGVEKVVSGYAGGQTKNPTYKEVCSGTTGHAEVAQISYDPAIVSLEEILEVFFQTHDPTQLNRQGNDVGTQYRSAIFYHSDSQKETSLRIIRELNQSGAWSQPIVTEVSKFTIFYPAEDYHQNYFNLNGNQPYCQYVVRPKLEKFKKVFKDKVKPQ